MILSFGSFILGLKFPWLLFYFRIIPPKPISAKDQLGLPRFAAFLIAFSLTVSMLAFANYFFRVEYSNWGGQPFRAALAAFISGCMTTLTSYGLSRAVIARSIFRDDE